MATFTLLPRSNRSGSFTTPSYNVPADASGYWLLRTNMTEADIAGAGLSGSIAVEVSGDGGNTWEVWAALTWESGFVQKPGPLVHNPGMGGPIVLLAGKTIRARVTLARTTRVGFMVEVNS